MRIFSAIIFSLVCNIAFAVPVTWTLNNVAFEDGATGSGSFVYDADTNVFSAINIATTAGNALGGAEYRVAGASGAVFPGAATSGILSFFVETQVDDDYSGEAILWAFLDASMTNNGGIIQLGTGAEGICGNPGCGSPLPGQARSVNSGFISAVPLPPALLLFGPALLVIGRFVRKA